MFRMSHDAVDFFSADFTAAGVIVAGEGSAVCGALPQVARERSIKAASIAANSRFMGASRKLMRIVYHIGS